MRFTMVSCRVFVEARLLGQEPGILFLPRKLRCRSSPKNTIRISQFKIEGCPVVFGAIWSIVRCWLQSSGFCLPLWLKAWMSLASYSVLPPKQNEHLVCCHLKVRFPVGGVMGWFHTNWANHSYGSTTLQIAMGSSRTVLAFFGCFLMGEANVASNPQVTFPNQHGFVSTPSFRFPRRPKKTY